MSGSLHDVKNSVWMKTVMISVGLLFAGIAAYAVLAQGIGTVKHHEWEDAHHDLEDAEAEWNAANESGTFEEKESADKAWQDAHHADIDAHLSYLTWSTAGKTIMVMFIVYAAFYGVAGFFNSIQPDDEDDDHHHGDDHEEHHGSASPILMAGGILLFMMGFPGFVVTCKSWLGLDYDPDMSGFMLSAIGMIITIMGIGNWWN